MVARKESGSSKQPSVTSEEKALELIRNALRNLRFGQITVYVQDGTVVMIERTEKQKLA